MTPFNLSPFKRKKSDSHVRPGRPTAGIHGNPCETVGKNRAEAEGPPKGGRQGGE